MKPKDALKTQNTMIEPVNLDTFTVIISLIVKKSNTLNPII